MLHIACRRHLQRDCTISSSPEILTLYVTVSQALLCTMWQTAVLCIGACNSEVLQKHIWWAKVDVCGELHSCCLLVKLEANPRFHKFRKQAVFIDKTHIYPIHSWTEWQADPESEFEIPHGVSSLTIGGLKFKGRKLVSMFFHHYGQTHDTFLLYNSDLLRSDKYGKSKYKWNHHHKFSFFISKLHLTSRLSWVYPPAAKAQIFRISCLWLRYRP